MEKYINVWIWTFFMSVLLFRKIGSLDVDPALCRINLNPVIIPTTGESIKFYLSVYNDLRNKTASGDLTIKNNKYEAAADMFQLVWSDNLAIEAEKKLSSCNMDILCYECYQFNFAKRWYQARPKILNYTKTNEKFQEQVLSKFFQDGGKFSTENLKNYGYNVQHNDFTLVSHAKTKYLGCATSESMTDYDAYTTICFFAPSEQMDSNILYEIGPSCSGCPQNYTCSTDYKNLCKENFQHIWEKVYDEKDEKYEISKRKKAVPYLPLPPQPSNIGGDPSDLLGPPLDMSGGDDLNFDFLEDPNKKKDDETGKQNLQANADLIAGSVHIYRSLILIIICLGLVFARN